jgi:hypothetical protein
LDVAPRQGPNQGRLASNGPFRLYVPTLSNVRPTQFCRCLCRSPWGDAWCSFYKSVSFDLPEDGLPLYSFVKGLLGLYVRAGGGVSLYNGTAMAVPGSVVLPRLPGGWPAEVAAVTVNGLQVAGTGRTLFCAAVADSLDCSIE